ncbi:P-loop containing nucleoside triphosphate hydrolase protein [Blastocladiella britannica]|nr:P-loop containing nucleoside triphosphate hydrolase protein [Blastocladiella britannica]
MRMTQSFLSTTALRSEAYDRDFRPRDTRQRDAHPRSSIDARYDHVPRSSHGTGNNHFNNGRRSGGYNRDEQSQQEASDWKSLKSPFEYTAPPPMAWANVPGLVPDLLYALTRTFRYEHCTPVQAAVTSRMPLERDAVVQAKTGTGKTLAFLIPAVNAMLANPEWARPASRHATKVLIVSPTRELAAQIAEEATKLCSHTRAEVHMLVGGESKVRQVRDLARRRVDIVVGTPGRLLDMCQTESRFRESLEGVQSFILDEADRMLEIGFKEDIERLRTYLPPSPQTLLFSATYPSNVQALVNSTLRPDYEVINTISPDDEATVDRITQFATVAPLTRHPQILYSILARGFAESAAKVSPKDRAVAESEGLHRDRNSSYGGHKSRAPQKPESVTGPAFKAIVFFPTTKAVAIYSELFRNLVAQGEPGVLGAVRRNHIFELHSKKSQAQRARIADTFKSARSGILFTSDVSARGVDYPGVDLVVQMGIPMSKDQYVHRVGRTGRAGRDGTGVMIIAPFERQFLDELNGITVTRVEAPLVPVAIEAADADQEGGAVVKKRSGDGPTVEAVASVNIGLGDDIAWDGEMAASAIARACTRIDEVEAEDAFLGSLGFYQGQMDSIKGSGYTGARTLEELEDFHRMLGMRHTPSLPAAIRPSFTARAAPMRRSGGGGGGYGGGNNDRRRPPSYGDRGGYGNDRDRSFGYGDRDRVQQPWMGRGSQSSRKY